MSDSGYANSDFSEKYQSSISSSTSVSQRSITIPTTRAQVQNGVLHDKYTKIIMANPQMKQPMLTGNNHIQGSMKPNSKGQTPPPPPLKYSQPSRPNSLPPPKAPQSSHSQYLAHKQGLASTSMSNIMESNKDTTQDDNASHKQRYHLKSQVDSFGKRAYPHNKDGGDIYVSNDNEHNRGAPPSYEYHMRRKQSSPSPAAQLPPPYHHRHQRSVDSTSSSDLSQKNNSDLGSSGSSLPLGYGGWSPSASVVRATPQSEEDRRKVGP